MKYYSGKYGQTLRGQELHDYRISMYGLKDKPITRYDAKLKALVWCFDSPKHGKPVAIGFAGNRKKADFYMRFGDADRRAQYIRNWLDGLQKQADDRATRRKKRSAGHSLKTGDILYSSWGYDQTNIDFYQVIEIVGKCTVKIRPVAQRTVDSTGYSDSVVAVPGSFTGEAITKRASTDNYISLNSYSCASVWDGKPKSQTAWGYGH